MNDEYENEPIVSENKSILLRPLIYIMVIVLLLVAIFVGVINAIIGSSSKYADVDYVKVDNVQIPTLYKYTRYNNVFTTRKISNLTQGNIRGSYVVIFYNNAIPETYKDTYIKELKKQGYKEVTYQDNELYVKNIENNTKFIYVIVSNLQVKYGVCTSGRYENILK